MFASAQVGQFSTGGVGQFYSGANKRARHRNSNRSVTFSGGSSRSVCWSSKRTISCCYIAAEHHVGFGGDATSRNRRDRHDSEPDEAVVAVSESRDRGGVREVFLGVPNAKILADEYEAM
jgi:hypothetical protein